MRDQQDTQIVEAFETARRLGWDVTIESGRNVCSVKAKRTAIFPGTRETEYDRSGITIARAHLRDALGHLLTIINVEATADESPLETCGGCHEVACLCLGAS